MSGFYATVLRAPFQSKTGFLLALLKSFLLSSYHQTICRVAYSAEAPVLQGADRLTSNPHKQRPVQRSGTLPKFEIEIHNLDLTWPFVTLNGQLCQLCASHFCAQRSMNLSPSTDKPLGFHIWGLCLAFTPYFIRLLRSCCSGGFFFILRFSIWRQQM